MVELTQIRSYFNGRFIAEPAAIQEKLFRTKAFVFDWDGVFNNSEKNNNTSSFFNEVDVTGIELLRLDHYLRNKVIPVTAVISGEQNDTAFMLARREHYHSVYHSIKDKRDALAHFCKAQDLHPQEIAYFFDDVIDLSIAAQCGIRIMLGRAANPLLMQLVQEKQLADYITAADGGHNGLREGVELLMGLSARYEDTIMQRVRYTDLYDQFVNDRETISTSICTIEGAAMVTSPQQ